MSDFATTE